MMMVTRWALTTMALAGIASLALTDDVGPPQPLPAECSTVGTDDYEHCQNNIDNYPTCYDGMGDADAVATAMEIGDGFCQTDLNTEECGYDGGDCCECSCKATGTEKKTALCVTNNKNCEDADWLEGGANCPYCSLVENRVDRARCMDNIADYYDLGCFNVIKYPTAGALQIGNGYCHPWYNNDKCGFDGGDCCRCSCTARGDYWKKKNCETDHDDNCKDTDWLEGGVKCPSYCNFVAEESKDRCLENIAKYPDCWVNSPDRSDRAVWQGDGECHVKKGLNTKKCGYDAGDCCRCSCTASGTDEKKDKCDLHDNNCKDSDNIDGGPNCPFFNDRGCWKDEAGDRIFGVENDYHRLENLTPDACFQRCSEEKDEGLILLYFGVQFGVECWCGNGQKSYQYDRYGRSDNCNMNCVGDATQDCGGRSAMRVFIVTKVW